jgi:hypothetical protein
LFSVRVRKEISQKYFAARETCHAVRLLSFLPGWWTTNMRILASVLISVAVALPCSAQTVLKSEPLALAAYEVAFVQDVSCPAGKVLKVTGAIRGLHRKRTCVALASEQASLAVATP